MAYLLGFAQFPQTFPPRYVNTKTLQKEWKLSMQRWPSGGVVLGGYFVSSRHGGEGRISEKNTTLGWCFWSGRRGSNSLPGIPRMAVAIRRSPASPQIKRASHRSRQRLPACPRSHSKRENPILTDGIFSFGAGDEARTRFPASHEWLSPFAGALPHLRSNVLRTGRGSDFQPARGLIPKEKIPS